MQISSPELYNLAVQTSFYFCQLYIVMFLFCYYFLKEHFLL